MRNVSDIRALAEKVLERSNPELKWSISKHDTGALASAVLTMLPVLEAALAMEEKTGEDLEADYDTSGDVLNAARAFRALLPRDGALPGEAT